MKIRKPLIIPLINQLSVSLVFFAVLIFGFFTTNTWADQKTDFSSWLQTLKEEAMAKGISQKTLGKALSGLKPLPKVIEKDRSQPEFKLTFDQYLKRLVSTKRIEKGKKNITAKRKLLTNISRQYGVPPHILVALWGVESDFGRLTGDLPVIASLATLAFDNRRSAYFRMELFEALHILDQGFIPFENLNGSWAGAMGQLQFMPSTFRAYGIDYDGDGKIKIWQDGGDLFASAAHYLAKSGWKAGLRWGREISLPRDFDPMLINVKTKKKLNVWKELGVSKKDKTDLPDSKIMASIIQPDGPGGRAFVVYKNFHALLAWNRSNSYALSVGILADNILNP